MRGCPPIPDPCYDCVHFVGFGGGRIDGSVTPDLEPDSVLVCKAFPRGIPEIVITGRDMHRNPLPGDGGIVYRKRP